MQFAEILSDLTSLRACDYNKAQALVDVHKTIPKPKDAQDKTVTQSDNDSHIDPDIQRAKDLLELHSDVKLRHQNYYHAGGLNDELSRIRQGVDRVRLDLEQHQEARQ